MEILNGLRSRSLFVFVFPALHMIAIRPPEYFPRIAYVALLLRADAFVLADTFQYSRQSYQNRAKLRTPQGWQWISVPLKARQHGLPAGDVAIRQRVAWPSKHRRAVRFNYGSAPYYPHYGGAVRTVFDTAWTHLGELTCRTVELVREWMGLKTPVWRASDLPGRPADLPSVAEAVGAKSLLIPPETVLHDARYGYPVRILEFEHPTYRQPFEGFEPGMSVLDLLFNYGPAARAMIEAGIHLRPAGQYG